MYLPCTFPQAFWHCERQDSGLHGTLVLLCIACAICSCSTKGLTTWAESREKIAYCIGAGINDFLRYALTSILMFPPHEFS